MADVRINEYRLLRAREGRMLAGVAAGLAQSSGLDVTVVRLCIGAMVLSGFGIAAYILMWIIVPEESPRRGRVIEPAPEQTARVMRVSLVGLAALSLINKVGGVFTFANPHARGVGFDGAIGLILLGVGIAVLFTRHRPERALWDVSSPPSRPATTASVGDVDDTPTFTGPFAEVVETVHERLSDAFSEMRTTIHESKPRTDDTGWNDYESYDDDVANEAPYASARAADRIVTVTGEPDRASGAALAFARIVGWLVLIWWVAASLAIIGGWAVDIVTVRSPLLLGAVSALVFIGVLRTLLHAKFARAIFPALALLAIPIAIAATTVRVTGDIGDVEYIPESRSEIAASYHQAIGRMTIDLSRADFDGAKTISARMGIGQLVVVVPDDATVIVHTRTDLGSYELFGRRSNGATPRESVTYPGCEGGPKVTLNMRTGVGETVVRYAHGDRPSCETRVAA